MQKRSLYIFVGTIVVGLIITSIPIIVKNYNPRAMNYKGVRFVFRRRIKDSYTVEVENKTEIFRLLANPPAVFVRNERVPWKIHIAFPNKTNGKYGLYAVEGFEITMKLKTYYLLNGMKYVDIDGVPINSEDELERLGGTVIYLIGPDIANETKIYLKKNIIYVMGKDEVDFDLAAMRLILLVLQGS